MTSPENRPDNLRHPSLRILEFFTACVLLAVLGALVWMIFAAYRPAAGSVPAPEWEIIGVTALLLAALALVSIVALLHTRK
jgi:hypothetical protein